MRIKLLKKCIVGKVQFALKAGTVIDAEDTEARALINIGYAKQTDEKPTADPYYGAKVAGIKTGLDAEPGEDASAGQVIGSEKAGAKSKSDKDKGDAPNNKSK